METIFKNLFNLIKAESDKSTLDFIATLNNETSTEDILRCWQYTELIPKGKKGKAWELTDLKNYLIARYQKKQEKRLTDQLTRLKTVEAAPDFKGATITVEWKRSRMWGSNPTAEADTQEGETYPRYVSGSIGGCGYDKQSTAVANVLNQSNAVLKLLYTLKEQQPTTKNHDLFGYGSGYGILPNIEGGVGTSCYPRIFEKVGFKFETIASGKSFDCYTIKPMQP